MWRQAAPRPRLCDVKVGAGGVWLKLEGNTIVSDCRERGALRGACLRMGLPDY